MFNVQDLMLLVGNVITEPVFSKGKQIVFIAFRIGVGLSINFQCLVKLNANNNV